MSRSDVILLVSSKMNTCPPLESVTPRTHASQMMKCTTYTTDVKKITKKSKLSHQRQSMWKSFCAVIAGSGSAAFNEPSVAELVVRLCRSNRVRANLSESDPPLRVAYIGTATYDNITAQDKQTSCLAALGCDVASIDVTYPATTRPIESLREQVLGSDAVVVSGGNSLYALMRWRQCGLDAVLREAATKGIVLAGGSAGALCWFDGGHSDSGDPTTFRPASPPSQGAESVEAQSEKQQQESPAAAAAAEWKYLRVSALGLFPGLLCPHHDRTQSNGTPRYIDYDAMLARHRGERGLCLDHWAALVIDRGEFSVFPVPGQVGSVVPRASADGDGATEQAPSSSSSSFIDATFAAGEGRPGVWVKAVVDAPGDAAAALVVARAVAPRGRLEDILSEAKCIAPETAAEEELMRRNPA